MYHYSVPPQGYVRYGYDTSATTSPSSSPAPEGAYAYYIPPQYKTPATPPRRNTRHSRKDSHGPAPAGWHSPAGYPSPSYYARQPDYASPPAKHQEHVSSHFDRIPGKARRYSTSAQRGGGNGSNSYGPQRRASVKTQRQPIIDDTSDDAEEPAFIYIKPHTGSKRDKYANFNADQYFVYPQMPAHVDPCESQKPRTRRPSESRPSTANKHSKAAPPREATAADARTHKIPAGYSLKNWDPEEEPVMLLGSVFDANSLGKWIYDWTVFHRGPATPISEVAGDLWLLLIKLAHKMKRAEESLPRIRNYDNQEMLEDFLDGGDRLWARFKKLLKSCEEYMWKVAKKEGAKGPVKMGKNSGCEFVDSIFGRDRKLEETESLMQSIRLWNMRFDANCEDVLRHPHA